MSKEKKETLPLFRFNYVVDATKSKKLYVGYVVNHNGVITQSDSLEGLEKRLKELLTYYLKRMLEKIEDKDVKIEMKPISEKEWFSK